jgi:hypothetical protein
MRLLAGHTATGHAATERPIRMAPRLMLGALALFLGSGAALVAVSQSGAASSTSHAAVAGGPIGAAVWTDTIADGPGTIVASSPNVADVVNPGSGALAPAVVVGDTGATNGKVYADDLATGTRDWTYTAGGPVQSTPSVAALTTGSAADSVFVGVGDAGTPQPSVGGYQAITPQGNQAWSQTETNPGGGSYGVQASLSVANLQGQTDVTAGSLSENQDAYTAAGGTQLSGFPWFEGDTNISTPALADLGNNGQTDIIEGGASTANPNVYGQQYYNGGFIRVVAPTGNGGAADKNAGTLCQYTPTQEVDSSPAVGKFFGASQEIGIVSGTGSYYPGASDTNKVIALNSQCVLAWSATLDGTTSGSPVLADVLGNGQLQVIEGTSTGTTPGAGTGSLYALNGADGSVLWKATMPGQVLGSVATVDLGAGYQDVIAPTTDGVVVLDGKTGNILQTIMTNVGFQNSPLITDDPDGQLGLTLAGYMGRTSIISHYIIGANGALADEPGAWPQFHLNPQLTGDTGTSQSIQVPCNAPVGAPYGYDLSASDGGVFTFGDLPFCGSTGSITLNKPIVGIALTKDAGGYWEVASDGGIFAFGDAAFYGSTGAIHLNEPIVGMAATPDGGGYWLVASDGGIFSFGDAAFYGSTGAIHLNEPIVGMAATPSGKGYWLVASDGGIFSFGDAAFYGSTGAVHLNQPIVGMAATPSGKGYWLVASDGGIFSFGDAAFYGSTGAIHLNKPIVGMAATPSGKGNSLVASDGGIFAFGDAPFYGSTGAIHLNKPMVGMAGI